MKIKSSPADTAFSLCIREAANHTCEWCGKVCGTTESPQEFYKLECSHVFTRTHRTIRWCKENAKALCFTCHKKWHDSPLASAIWFDENYGTARREILQEKMRSRVKVSKLEEKEIAKHYRQEYKKMVEAKKQGATNVDFVSYQ